LLVVTFGESKRQADLAKHGIDLAERSEAFDAPTLTQEDAREAQVSNA